MEGAIQGLAFAAIFGIDRDEGVCVKARHGKMLGFAQCVPVAFPRYPPRSASGHPVPE